MILRYSWFVVIIEGHFCLRMRFLLLCKFALKVVKLCFRYVSLKVVYDVLLQASVAKVGYHASRGSNAEVH